MILTLIPSVVTPAVASALPIAYAYVFCLINPVSLIVVVIPVTPKNWVLLVPEYVAIPVVPFLYLNVKAPKLGNPIVESTSI